MRVSFRCLLDDNRYVEADEKDVSKFTVAITEEMVKYTIGGQDAALNRIKDRLIEEQRRNGYDFIKLTQTASRKDKNYRKESEDIFLMTFIKKGQYAIGTIADLPKDKFGQPIWR